MNNRPLIPLCASSGCQRPVVCEGIAPDGSVGFLCAEHANGEAKGAFGPGTLGSGIDWPNAKLDLEELPYEPACSVQRLDNWAAVDHQKTLTLPAWIVEDAKKWAVITDCEGDFVALVSNEKADLICRVLNEAGK